MNNDEIKKRAEAIFYAINYFNISNYSDEDVDKIMPYIVEYAKNRERYDDAIQEACYNNGCDVNSFSQQEYAVRCIVENVKNVNIYLCGPNTVVPRIR